jgi:hypothetical protein
VCSGSKSSFLFGCPDFRPASPLSCRDSFPAADILRHSCGRLRTDHSLPNRANARRTARHSKSPRENGSSRTFWGTGRSADQTDVHGQDADWDIAPCDRWRKIAFTLTTPLPVPPSSSPRRKQPQFEPPRAFRTLKRNHADRQDNPEGVTSKLL